MKYIGLLLLFFVPLAGFSQNLPFVKAQVKTLSDSSFYGRGYIHNGSNLAANYVASQFGKIGIQPIDTTYFQPFDFEVNTFPEKTTVSCDGKILKEGYDYLIDPVSGSSAGIYQIVHLDSANFQTNSSFPGINKKNVYVIDMAGINTEGERSHSLEFTSRALEKSPVIRLKSDKLMWTVGQQQFPNALIEIEKDDFCRNAKKVNIQIKNKEIPFEARNVIGKIEGFNHDSCIVITAHYDHLGMMGDALFPGASDNASGTAMMLDFAQYYSQNKPEYDVCFIAFAAEEAGLIGSHFFVENPTFPLSKIKFLINLDLMGSAADGIAVVNGTLFPERIEKLKSINTTENLLPRIKLRGKAANSDHYWFSENGVPAIFIYTIGNAKAYHDVHDVYEGLDWANYDQLFTLLREFIKTL